MSGFASDSSSSMEIGATSRFLSQSSFNDDFNEYSHEYGFQSGGSSPDLLYSRSPSQGYEDIAANDSQDDGFLQENLAFLNEYFNGPSKSLSNFSSDEESIESLGSSRAKAGTFSDKNLSNQFRRAQFRPMPDNLLQDACSKEFDALPAKYKSAIEDLTKKISYQMNFFTPSDTSGPILQLTCKLCELVLPIGKVESHVRDQEHLNNLAGKVDDKQAVDSKAFDCRMCTLCNEELEGTYNSLIEHRQSKTHQDKLRTLYRKDVMSETGSSSSMPRNFFEKNKGAVSRTLRNQKDRKNEIRSGYEKSNTRVRNSSNNSTQFMSQNKNTVHNRSKTPSREQTTSKVTSLKVILDKLVEGLNEHEKKTVLGFGRDAQKIFYSFTKAADASGWHNFICNVCKMSLYPKHVKAHLFNCTGVKDQMENFRFVNLEDLDDKDVAKVTRMKVLFKNHLYFFQLIWETCSHRLFFFCKVCNIPLRGKEKFREHVNSDKHSHNILANPLRIAYASLSHGNQRIVTGLSAVIKKKISHYNFVYMIGTEKLRFACKVCPLCVLSPKDAEEHVDLPKHLNALKGVPCGNDGYLGKIVPKSAAHSKAPNQPSKTARSSPQALDLFSGHHDQNSSYASSETSSLASDKIATRKKGGASSFSKAKSPSAETGRSKKVTSYIKHLPEEDKKIFEKFGNDAEMILDSFHCTHQNGHRLNFICNVCKLCLYPKYVQSHLQDCSCVKNLMKDLCLVYLEDLNGKNRSILQSLTPLLSNDMFFIELYYKFGTNLLQFFCNICHEVLGYELVKHHITSNAHLRNLQTKPFSLNLETLSNGNQCIVKEIANTIKERMMDFCLVYKIGTVELHFYCKPCRVILFPGEVKAHTKAAQHLDKINSKYSRDAGIPNVINVNPAPSKYAPETTAPRYGPRYGQENSSRASGGQRSVTQGSTAAGNDSSMPQRSSTPLSETGRSKDFTPYKFLPEKDRKILEGFRPDVEKILDSFEWTYENSHKLNFICNVCKLCLYPQYVQAHLKNCTAEKNSMKNLCLVHFEDLNLQNKTILQSLTTFFTNDMFFFQMYYKFATNLLQFLCTVCNELLNQDQIRNHVTSDTHLDNLQTNPFSLKLETLSHPNQRNVKEIAATIKERMTDFCLVYRIGSKELHYYCKLCQSILKPGEVKAHVSASLHMDRVNSKLSKQREVSEKNVKPACTAASKPTATINGGRSDQVSPPRSNTQQQQSSTVKDESSNILYDNIAGACVSEGGDSQMYDFLRSLDSNELYFRCNFCDLTVEQALALKHFRSEDHLNNVELNDIFEDFAFLDKLSKSTVKDLFTLVGNEVRSYSLISSDNDRVKIMCKVCGLTVYLDTVDPAWLSNHLKSENHRKDVDTDGLGNESSVASVLPVNDLKTAPTNQDTVQAIKDNHSPSNVSYEIPPGPSNLNQSKPISDVLNKNSSQRPKKCRVPAQVQCQDVKTGPAFVCEDCTFNTDRLVGSGDKKVSRDHAMMLFTKCCGKSAAADFPDLRVRVGSLRHEPSRAMSPGPKDIMNDSDKKILREVINKIGFQFRDFDFTYLQTCGSKKLRFYCKLCDEFPLTAECLEKHISSESHTRLSDLADISSIRYKHLNDQHKTAIRKLYDKIGRDIKYFFAETSILLICKVCGEKISSVDAEQHVKSHNNFRFLRQGDVISKMSESLPTSFLKLLSCGINSDEMKNQTSRKVTIHPCMPADACDIKPSHSENSLNQSKPEKGTAFGKVVQKVENGTNSISDERNSVENDVSSVGDPEAGECASQPESRSLYRMRRDSCPVILPLSESAEVQDKIQSPEQVSANVMEPTPTGSAQNHSKTQPLGSVGLQKPIQTVPSKNQGEFQPFVSKDPCPKPIPTLDINQRIRLTPPKTKDRFVEELESFRTSFEPDMAAIGKVAESPLKVTNRSNVSSSTVNPVKDLTHNTSAKHPTSLSRGVETKVSQDDKSQDKKFMPQSSSRNSPFVSKDSGESGFVVVTGLEDPLGDQRKVGKSPQDPSRNQLETNYGPNRSSKGPPVPLRFSRLTSDTVTEPALSSRGPSETISRATGAQDPFKSQLEAAHKRRAAKNSPNSDKDSCCLM